jgi:hypothetical protein
MVGSDMEMKPRCAFGFWAARRFEMGRKTRTINVVTSTSQTSGAKVVPLRPVSTTPSQSPTRMEITREQIARRAYEIWVKQGCCHGRDQQHWLDAESQLKAEVDKT